MLSFREYAHVALWTQRHLLNVYHEPELDLIRPFLEPTDTCIDVGAHAGSWMVPLSRLVPQGRVLGVEALPYYARVLRKTLRLLRRNNVEIIGKAVLDAPKSVEMVWQDPSGQRLTGLTHVASETEATQPGTITVEGTTLDAYATSMPGRLRFIKLDIEGAELLALKGAATLIARHRPFIYTELDAAYCARYNYTPADLFAYLGGHNYHAYLPEATSHRQPVDAKAYAQHADNNVWFVPAEEAEAFLKTAV
jgi:FkbM family methyltransferase